MKIRVRGFQFLSRSSIKPTVLGKRKIAPQQRPEITYELVINIIDKPFEINFAQVISSRPSIGAAEYIDQEIDLYMTRRWPRCLMVEGTIDAPISNGELSLELVRNFLTFLRKVLWTSFTTTGISTTIEDQFARIVGYRREYFDRQMFDISGNRRPSSKENYVPTEVWEPTGPGVASLLDIDCFESINEFVWSSIIPFPQRSTLKTDLPQLHGITASIRKHYNSYNELNDANRHISRSPPELKASVRSAASAVDAILRYNCTLWGVPFPKGRLQFDEKIENVLLAAGKPSYRIADPKNLQDILYLYRCRNSMHEGDCYYQDNKGQKVDVKSESQVRVFISAVENFVIWIDSLV